MPSEGWQITRKHAQLPKEELARLIQMGGSSPDDQEGSEAHTEHSDVKVGVSMGLAGALDLNRLRKEECLVFVLRLLCHFLCV